MERFNATLMKMVPEVVGLILFFGAAYFSYMTFIWTKSPFLQLFFLAILLTTTIIRVLSISSHILFSPAVLQFRILPIQCQSANLIYRLIVWTGSYMTIALMITIIVHRLGAEINTVISLRLLFATLLLAATALSVLIYKNRITETLLSKADNTISWGRRKFISLWHVLVLVYLFILWLLLINTIDSSEQMLSKGAFILSFLVVPIWLIADQLIQWIVKYSMSTLKIYQEDSLPVDASEEEYEQHEMGQSSYLRLKSYSRIVVVIAILIWIASLWGINIPFFSKLTSVLFNASIILALALIFWQFTSSWIERKIQMAIPEEEEENEDDEWGSAASRGRSYTLLPMVRKFIGTVLVIMVTMTILSSMGVDIGPLLAGAGVVGLAIGFGAQKLVSDMFSGFFYLLDDAFRVGEYLEAGTVSGTVEKITLRNILLRHHRGMLQIVPHSELGAITNFMRGGIVVKFNLDFPYDANIDLIRRVIKKVGQAMLEDEEFGKDFIKPVKSQGVREITNSVMTIRVKFTAQPGSHFVIRREAYKRITEALSAKKIPYAHKKVIVDLPADNGATPNKDQIKAAGAAALQAAEQTEQLNISDQSNESGAFD